MKTVIILVSVISFIVLILAYYGAFTKIEAKIETHESNHIVYKPVTGSYKQSGVVSDEVYWDLLNNYKVETCKGIGLYFDNPKETKTEELRSEIGCVLESLDIPNLEEIKTKYKMKELPKGNYPTIQFPYKGKLSVILGLLKVYPALNKYKEENKEYNDSFIIEIWDIPNRKIIYRINNK